MPLFDAGDTKVGTDWLPSFEGFLHLKRKNFNDQSRLHNNMQRSSGRTEISRLKVQNSFLIILVTLLEIVLEMRLPDDSSINLQRKTTVIYQKICLPFNLLKENRLRKSLCFYHS